MIRAGFVLLGLICCGFAAGCCMCDAPYDYCAPTFTGRCGEGCRPMGRVGSAFCGPCVPSAPNCTCGEIPQTETFGPTPQPQPYYQDGSASRNVPPPPSAPVSTPPPSTYDAARGRDVSR